jgi:hypothetical protein
VSALPDELPRKTIIAWRQFLGTADGQLGLDWIRRNHCPRIDRETVPGMVESGIALAQHHASLDDIERILTSLPKVERSAEQPGLEMPDSQDDN